VPSLQAKPRNPDLPAPLDCFVASLLAMMDGREVFGYAGSASRAAIGFGTAPPPGFMWNS